jgi:predicted DNA-binding transcriptional regulator AlpA
MSRQSAILTSREVDELVPISPTTRWRQEKLGRFPRSFKISSRMNGYHRADVETWLADPEGWATRQTAPSEAQQQ